MNVSSWLKQAKTQVSSLDADLIMLTALGKTERSELVLCAERELTNEESEMLAQMLKLRKMHVPMAYLTGHKEFYGRDFKVSPAVLIPRPETETIIDIAKQLPEKKVVDVGTGSGCIAITLALETNKQVAALDISKDALIIAKENAKNLHAKVQFIKSDLLDNYQPEQNEIIVANLPYVDPAWEWTSPELKFEPKLALFAEDGGLNVIFRLLDQLHQLKHCGPIILEADLSQHQEILNYAKNLGLNCIAKDGLILLLQATRWWIIFQSNGGFYLLPLAVDG